MKKAAIKIIVCLLSFIPLAHSQGKIMVVEDFKSQYVDTRNVEIWLPEEYSSDKQESYPVLYMQDGQNLFSDDTAMGGTSWQAARTAQNLISEGTVKPFIIVAVWSTTKRYLEYLPQKATEYLSGDDLEQVNKIMQQAGISKTEFLADNYLKFITEELKPYIDSEFRTKTDAADTSICGSSMGALLSLYGICEYPDTFGNAACISTHWPVLFDYDNMNAADAVRKYLELKLPKPESHRIYFDYGGQGMDQNYDVHQKIVDNMMQQAGYTQGENWTTKVYPDADHDERAWGERFDQVLLFLYKK